MTRRSRRLSVMTLDDDTLAALDIAAATAEAAGLPTDAHGPRPGHPHGRSSMVRYIVRDWEKRGGLRDLQARARKEQK
ncbi:MAG: hypothetical protein LLG45_03810 [Actinomycetia bacterium]|nr:hypothetical protein [Actinomycetes bacterium]